MKFLKYFTIIFCFFILIFLAGINYISKKGLPENKGNFKVFHLQKEVRILRDKYGIPHIFARNIFDLFYAIGFVHAQDRLWQMEFFRRVSQGRLTEIFGNVKISAGGRENLDLLSQDKFYRTVGFKYYAEKSFEKFPPLAKKLLEKYSQGVNEYIERDNLPLEFLILGYKPERWKPADTLSIAIFIAWELTSNWDVELLRYLVSLKIGEEKMWKLLPKIHPPGPYIVESSQKNYFNKKENFSEVLLNPLFVKKILNLSQNIKLISPASNNWVVSGKKSISGKPVLANDPHLTHFLPSIFYQIHLVCNDLDVIGISFPGLPFVVLGHNRNFAWAATTTNADTSDLFVEKTNPKNHNQYLYKGRWKNFEKREEEIRVKNGKKFKTVKLEILSTVHGPIINSIYPEFLKESPLISLCWSGFYAKVGGEIYLRFMKAKNIKDFILAVKENEIPIQNWIFADKDGNIGYFPGGLIPVRKKGDGTFPVEGWSGEYDWCGFIPPEEIPQIYNPENNYIVTANNKVIDERKYKYIISYDYPPSYRAERIIELLNSKKKLSASDMEKFQKDNYSKQGEKIAKYFIEACEKIRGEKIYTDACRWLKRWDFHTDIESIGATIFYKTYSIALKKTLEDELGEDILKIFSNSTRLESFFDRLLQENSPDTLIFFDNIKTPEIETKDQILRESFKEAVIFLRENFGNDVKKWRWGKLHHITFFHPFSSVKILKRFFSAGKFEAAGARHVVDVAYYNPLENFYNAVHGAAYRMVIDMANVENARMIIDTGQSGHIRSRHFKDQLNLWLEGKTIPMLMDEKIIRKNLEGELILEPGK